MNFMMHILHLFTLLFVGLKLTGVITWSWWVVLVAFVLALILAAIPDNK